MTKQTEGQLTLFDLGICAGKMSPEPSAPPNQRISGRYLRKPAELRTVPYLYLDLREGYGNLLGPYWEINSPLLGEYTMLNTGPAPPREENVYTLSQILEATPHHKYYLSKTACLGILRRARKRGKELPPVLKRALEIQAEAPEPLEEDPENA
jgi:hypothetical protein